ncbi:MAG: dihydrodipicolinate synthase family protein [Chloroflexi bacterium]|nr:dihydrodipicolinate synthase family protein [Chloroflexota bacterium]
MPDTLRGIFPVLQTPLDACGALDMSSLQREVVFNIKAGAHGLVFPVLGSEFQFLSDNERRHLVEVVIAEASGHIPVVVGVAGPSAAVAQEHAAHAAAAGAEAVIALPPYIAGGSPAELLHYYRTIAAAAQVPVFVQNSGAGMSPDFLGQLLREVPGIHYIKEEAAPSAHHISAVANLHEPNCWGIFGGALGRWMISEMRRGACGFMPAAELTDVYVACWDAFQAGDEPGARIILNKLMPEINLATLLGMRVCKEVLVRRGVFACAAMRQPGCPELDDEDQHELDAILADLEPLYRI